MSTTIFALRARAMIAALLLAVAFAAPSPAHGDAGAPACPPPLQPPTPQELAAAQAVPPQDRGALWRVTKDGRTSHLYGTIHIGRLGWAFYGPQMSAALTASDVLALELDLFDPQLASRLSAASRPDGVPPLVLPPGLQARLQRRLEAACLPPAAVAAFADMHPALQVATLMTLVARSDGLEPGYGQEFILAGLAQRFGRPVVGLESPEQQVGALLSGGPEVVLRELDQNIAQIEDGRARLLILRLADNWERGDVAALEQYEQWCDCIVSEDDRARMRAVNDDRNQHMADGIARLHGEGKRVFAAVGVLHMSGAKALPTLLTGMGFNVERVEFANAPPAAVMPAAPLAAAH